MKGPMVVEPVAKVEEAVPEMENAWATCALGIGPL